MSDTPRTNKEEDDARMRCREAHIEFRDGGLAEFARQIERELNAALACKHTRRVTEFPAAGGTIEWCADCGVRGDK